MRYIDDGVPGEENSLPARAAGVAIALSSVASFVAVVFLSRVRPAS
jgi:hypothetical protein